MRRIANRILVPLLIMCALGSCSNSSDQNAPVAQSGFDPAAPWRNFPSRDPAGTALSYWRLIQIGAYPAAAQGYDASVIDTVGSDAFLEALALQRTGAAALKPQVDGVREVPGGTVVELDARNSSGNGGAYSFILRPNGSTWRIAYDSLLGESIESSLAVTIEKRTSGEERPGRTARRRAAAVAQAYRRAGLGALQRKPGAEGSDEADAPAEPIP
jgi:hypothetical protein